MSPAAMFSSRCATDFVPGIGTIAGERRSSQARASWPGVAPYSLAALARTLSGPASLPMAIGFHGMNAMPSRSQWSRIF